jgi:hypothetical protein
MTPDMQSIAQRLEEIEKQVAHLGALITEQTDPDKGVAAGTIVARRFLIRDEKGQQRAELGMETTEGQTEAQPYLGLFDASERVRACIHVDAEGPSLELYSANGKGLAEVREFPEGPSITLFDTNGATRLCLKVSDADRGGSFAYLFGPDGKQNLRIELFSSGQASLVMQAPNGEPRVLLVVSKSDEASLAFLKDNNVGWTAP